MVGARVCHCGQWLIVRQSIGVNCPSFGRTVLLLDACLSVLLLASEPLCSSDQRVFIVHVDS